MKAIGQVAGGVAAYDAGKYTQRMFRQNAQTRQGEGVMERERIRLAARMAEGRQLVAQGSSGFQVGTGSALDELRDSATARELDLLVSHFNADSGATAFRQQGTLAYRQGYSALTGGIISGAATIMDEAAAAFGGGGGAGMSAAGQKAFNG